MTEPIPFVDLERWRPLQDSLIQVLGLNIGLVDTEGRPLTTLVDLVRVPWNVLTSSTKGFSKYEECVHSLLVEARKQTRPFVCTQVGGLHLCVVPIRHQGQLIAYFLLGPCLVGRRGEPDDYTVLAKDFDIPIDRWMEALQEIKVLSFMGLNDVASLLQRLGDVIVASKSEELRRQQVWDRFLETAMQAINAEAGSILLSQGTPDELRIQTARGLPDEVVKTARVRLGEGVAGVAAQEQRMLRINAETPHPRLLGSLQRPHLQDALVVPLSRDSNLVGVLCVSTSKPGGRFKEESVAMLQQIVQLMQVSLS